MLNFICPHCNSPFQISGKKVDKLIYHKYTCSVCHTLAYFPLQHFTCSNCGNSFYLKKTIQEYADSIIRCPLCDTEKRPTVYQFTCRVCGEERLLAEERANSSSRSFHCIKCGALNSIDPKNLIRYVPQLSQFPSKPQTEERSKERGKVFKTYPKTESPIGQGVEDSTINIIGSGKEDNKTEIHLKPIPQEPKVETYPIQGGEAGDSTDVDTTTGVEVVESTVSESPRIRRLRADEKDIAKYCRSSKYVRIIQKNGTPPDYYVVEYRVRGVERVENNGADVIFRDVHQVEIRLEGTYPRSAPICRMLTPIFHPNIEPAMICIGDDWSAQLGLADLIVHIGQIITYQQYNVKSPLDGFAAQWAEINSENFPIDDCDLFPPEGNKVLSLLDE